MTRQPPKRKSISYTKWGYIFLLPFFLSFCLFTLYPLVRTFGYSFYEYYRAGLKVVGPTPVGLQNFLTIFTNADLGKFIGNTLILWLLGFIPQIVIALLLAVWFTDLSLKIRCQGFFKTVIYMPNLIMASSFAMLFFALFSDGGPINAFMQSIGLPAYSFLRTVEGTRGLVGLMNFLMWFGNTTIVLMAGIMGIDNSLFEAAEIDGASSFKTFTRVTLPLIKPILSYTMISALIGGLQMFDVPQILTNATGNPNRTSMTIIMLLNNYLSKSKNYGFGGSLSVILFVMTSVLSLMVFYSLNGEAREQKRLAKLERKGAARG